MGLDAIGLGSVADLVKDGLDRLFPNKNDPAYLAAQAALTTAQGAAALKSMDDQFQLAIEQVKANAAEAATPGFHFRDGAGWVCVAAFAFAALKAPIEWGATLAGHPVSLPSVDTSITTSMLLGLLGLGGMHAYQQIKT